MKKQRELGKELEDFDQEEQEAEQEAQEKERAQGTTGEVDFTDFEPDPVLENEFHGGFRPTEQELTGRQRGDGRYGDFSRSYRVPKGWVTEPGRGLVDGVMPEWHKLLKRVEGWPSWRHSSWLQSCSIRFYAASEARDWQGVRERWRLAEGASKVINIAGKRYRVPIAQVPAPLDKEARPPRQPTSIEPEHAANNHLNFPFTRRWLAEHLADQKRPTVTPERDRAEEVEEQEWRQALSEAPTDPNRGPSDGFARGVRCEEYKVFRADSGEQEDDEQWGDSECWDSSERWSEQWQRAPKYRPSETLEANRFPTLKRIKNKNPRLTKTYLYGEPRPKLGTEKRWSRRVGVPVNELVRGKYEPALGISKNGWVASQKDWQKEEQEGLQEGLPKLGWPEIQGKPFAVKLTSAKDALRAYGVVEVAKFFAKGGKVIYCPPEKTTRMMDKSGVRHLLSHVTQVGHTIWVTAVPSKKKTPAKRMGRPLVYQRPMTAAERKAHSRAMQVTTRAPNTRVRPDADRRPHPPPPASGSFIREFSSRVIRRGNMITVTAIPTPRRSKEPLIGEIMISCKPWSTPTLTEVPFDSLSTELRLLALGLPLHELPRLQT